MPKNLKGKTVLVDIYQLYIAETGIATYLNDLIDILDSDESEGFNYVFYPAVDKVRSTESWRRKRSFIKRILMQLDYFVHKQLKLPIKSIKEKADFLIVPDYYAPVLRTKAKKVVVFHDTFFWETPEHYGKLWGGYFRKIVRLGIDQNTTIVSITNYTKSQISRYLSLSNSIEVLHNPMPSTEIGDISILKSLGLEGQSYFLHVGVLEKRKNLVLLIKAFSHFLSSNKTEHKLVLVGKEAPGERFNDSLEIRKAIKDCKIEDRVFLTGFLPNESVTALYQNAFAYVFPSNNEGFGYPILEAFMHNCPIIISNQGALTEVASEAALVFDSKSEVELSKCLSQLVESDSLKTELIHRGKQRIKDFARSEFQNKLEDRLNKIS